MRLIQASSVVIRGLGRSSVNVTAAVAEVLLPQLYFGGGGCDNSRRGRGERRHVFRSGGLAGRV